MKILVLTNLYPPHFLGGYELLCEEVSNHHAGKGHEITVLTSTHCVAPEGMEETTPAGRVVRRLKLEVPFENAYSFSPLRRASIARENGRITEQLLREFAPDVVIAWSQLRLTLGPVIAATRLGVPITWCFNDASLLSFRDTPLSARLRSRVRSFLSRSVLPGSSFRGLSFKHSTAISAILKEDLLAGGLPVEEARLIPQGIVASSFPPREAPGAIAFPMRVCYTGQLQRYKGVHIALKAVQKYAAKRGTGSITMTIVGSGPADYEAELRQLAADGTAEVHFKSRVPRAELAGIYREHDVFVFPSSWREPFGLTHLEAMASGLVVVSTVAGGQREFLSDGENSLVFPVDDVDALEGCLERLQDDPELAKKLARAGGELIAREYTLESYADALEKLMQECSSGAGT